jgi:hypothetical protein
MNMVFRYFETRRMESLIEEGPLGGAAFVGEDLVFCLALARSRTKRDTPLFAVSSGFSCLCGRKGRRTTLATYLFCIRHPPTNVSPRKKG